MEIMTLLEQELSIMDKLKSATKTIKIWFENKIDSANEIFDNAKSKVNDFLRKSSTTVKGEDKSKLSKLKDALSKNFKTLKELCSNIIKICKESISSLITIEKVDFEAERIAAEKQQKKEARLEKIRENKEKVMTKLAEASNVLTIISSIVISSAAIYGGYKSIENKRKGVD